MARFLIRLLANAIALWAAVQIVPGLSFEGSVWGWLGIALIFGIVNALVRPIVLFFSCPLVLLTLGLFVLIVNALMLSLTIWLSSDVLGFGIGSTGFWATFWGAIVISVVSWLISLILPDDRDRREYA